MLSRLFMSAVAGVTVAVGYCIYFDHKRRSDPDYRQRVRERRIKLRQAANRANGMPDPSDAEAVQRYFMLQLQRGEACMMNGMIEESIMHFCNAVRSSGSPSQILRILSESIPPQVFNMIVKRLSEDPLNHMSMQSSSRSSHPLSSQGGEGTAFMAGFPPGMDMDSGDHMAALGSAAGGPTITLVDDELE